MNQKVYHTLEYYKILDRLADYASCEEAKDRCHKLVPLTGSCGNCTSAGNYGRRTQPPVPWKRHQFFRCSQCQCFPEASRYRWHLKYHRTPYDLFSVGSCQAGQSIRPKRPQR